MYGVWGVQECGKNERRTAGNPAVRFLAYWGVVLEWAERAEWALMWF